jgi:hypothetical protein
MPYGWSVWIRGNQWIKQRMVWARNLGTTGVRVKEFTDHWPSLYRDRVRHIGSRRRGATHPADYSHTPDHRY